MYKPGRESKLNLFVNNAFMQDFLNALKEHESAGVGLSAQAEIHTVQV